MEKIDDHFDVARKDLKNLSDIELNNLFWKLTDDIVQPIVELSKTKTTPSIERSVLQRMGFNSIVSTQIVNQAIKYNLIRKGCGQLVMVYAQQSNQNYLEAGNDLTQDKGWDSIIAYFSSKA